MNDPYRELPGITCVRCTSTLQPDADWLVCPRGCGGWIERVTLPDLIEQLGELDRFAGVTGSCPHCNADLDARAWSTLRFETCNAHGVWLDAGEETLFNNLLVSARLRVDRIADLAARLATQTPAVHRELAARIIDLEDQVALLRRR